MIPLSTPVKSRRTVPLREVFEEISKKITDETKELIEGASEGYRQDLKVGDLTQYLRN